MYVINMLRCIGIYPISDYFLRCLQFLIVNFVLVRFVRKIYQRKNPSVIMVLRGVRVLNSESDDEKHTGFVFFGELNASFIDI